MEKWTNTPHVESVEGMVLVGQDFRVVRKGSPATDAFIMPHEEDGAYYTRIPQIGPLNLKIPSHDSSIASAVVPHEEGVDRFRDKEEEETPLNIIPSGSNEITVKEYCIVTLRCEGTAVDEYNDPTPENAMHYDYVLPTPSSLNFRFHGVDPWCQSGKFWRQLVWEMVDNTAVYQVSFNC